MYGDSAIVVGIYHAKAPTRENPTSTSAALTDTWVFTEGRWQCAASHTSLLKKVIPRNEFPWGQPPPAVRRPKGDYLLPRRLGLKRLLG